VRERVAEGDKFWVIYHLNLLLTESQSPLEIGATVLAPVSAMILLVFHGLSYLGLNSNGSQLTYLNHVHD